MSKSCLSVSAGGRLSASVCKSVSKSVLLVHSAHYQSDLSVLGTKVAFAQDRGKRVLDELRKEFGAEVIDESLREPCPLTSNQLSLVHDRAYLDSLKLPATWQKVFGTAKALDNTVENRRLLRKLLREYRIKSGGTLTACRAALKRGLAANLGAGYHHSYKDHGDGFCLINDVAASIRVLQKEGLVKRVLIVDTDFHQGNGTSKIFAADDQVFTLDVHSKEGWPYHKEKSSLDVAVKKDITPQEYIDKLKKALKKALASFANGADSASGKPDLVVFVQGADAYENGQLNKGEGFSLPLSTMKERDELIIDTFVQLGVPLALVFAGGYGPHAWEAHYQGVKHLLFRAGALSDTSAAD